MTVEQLKAQFLNDLITSVNPLQSAIIDECCENVLNGNISSNESLSPETLVGIGYQSAYMTLRGIVMGLFSKTDADMITLTYRGQEFPIYRDSLFVQRAVKKN